MHMSKSGHKIVFSVVNDILTFEREYREEIENENRDIKEVEEHLLRTIDLKGDRDCCSHSTTPQNIIYNETRCLSKKNKCDVKDLWVCFTCGYSACGRKQVYLEGNNHMETHYKETKHSKAVRNDLMYCYVCEKYVYDVNFGDVCKLTNYAQIKDKNAEVYEMIKQIVKLNEEQKDSLFNIKEIDYELDYDVPDENDVKSKNGGHIAGHKGITNNGNTCYISCVFQLLADILNFTTFHFLKCSVNPFNCLLCQITRVCRELKSTEKSLKELTENTSTDYINIKDLIKCLQREGLVVDGIQQDFSELLFLILERLRSEETNEIVCGVNELLIGLVVREWCDGCGKEKLADNEQYFVILSEKRYDVLSSKDEVKNGEDVSKRNKITNEHSFGPNFYFFEEECLGKCSCGGTRHRNTLINKLPTKLIIINNHRIENNEFHTNDQIPAHLDLDDLIYKVKVDDKLVNEILSLGFSKQEIQKALCLTNNNLNKSVEMLLSKNGKVSDNSEFKLFGGVKYYVTGMNNGHYIYIRDSVVIDDKEIRKVKVNERFYKHFLVLVYRSVSAAD